MANGKNQLRLDGNNKRSDPLSIAVAERDRNTMNMVRDALNNNQALLAFQPVVQTACPDRPAFYEGLIRLRDHTGRIIPAREFICSVENDEMGRTIDCIALDLGLQALQQEKSLRLSINMSAKSISYQRWKRILNRGLTKDPTVGERLILEITERSAMNQPDDVRTFVEDLHNRGISFALDDFGADYTALRYLKDFYFDILKIDGQFIRNIHKNPANQALTKAIVSIAQHFEMFTVAELVDNSKDAEFLVDSGIDCMQGYYFGVPTICPYWMQDQDCTRKVS